VADVDYYKRPNNNSLKNTFWRLMLDFYVLDHQNICMMKLNKIQNPLLVLLVTVCHI
jgi:hypothetical protein